MLYIIIFSGIIFMFIGITFLIKGKKEKEVEINTPEIVKKITHQNIGLETIKGTSYLEEKKQNDINEEINSEEEIVEISNYIFEVKDEDDEDYDGEIYGDEDDEIINLKLNEAANILTEIDIANKEYVEEIESMIFNQVMKNENIEQVEKVLEKKVGSFISGSLENNYEQYKQELINK